MQFGVEVAGDAGEDHGIRLGAVDEVLGGGRGVHESHAADGDDDVQRVAGVRGEFAVQHGEARAVLLAHVGARVGDVCGFFFQSADDGDGTGHGSSIR